jgi:hypothetical protein
MIIQDLNLNEVVEKFLWSNGLDELLRKGNLLLRNWDVPVLKEVPP